MDPYYKIDQLSYANSTQYIEAKLNNILITKYKFCHIIISILDNQEDPSKIQKSN